MGFFDRPDGDFEDDEPVDDFDIGTSPWIGGVVPLEVVLARNEKAAVVLSSVVAYRHSFDFTIKSFSREAIAARFRTRTATAEHHDR